jgi:hypothetical protein
MTVPIPDLNLTSIQTPQSGSTGDFIFGSSRQTPMQGAHDLVAGNQNFSVSAGNMVVIGGAVLLTVALILKMRK